MSGPKRLDFSSIPRKCFPERPKFNVDEPFQYHNMKFRFNVSLLRAWRRNFQYCNETFPIFFSLISVAFAKSGQFLLTLCSTYTCLAQLFAYIFSTMNFYSILRAGFFHPLAFCSITRSCEYCRGKKDGLSSSIFLFSVLFFLTELYYFLNQPIWFILADAALDRGPFYRTTTLLLPLLRLESPNWRFHSRHWDDIHSGFFLAMHDSLEANRERSVGI